MNIEKLLNDLQFFSKNGDYNKIKKLTQDFEKHILDNYKSDYDLITLMDDLTHSSYTLLNTLLIKEQYPDFLSLGTKKYFKDRNIELLDGATPIKILRPINEEFVFIKNKETIKNINDLNQNELGIYYNKDNNDIVFHHRNFKGLQIVELFDVKDTTMKQTDYEQGPLPALFNFSYEEIYNSFVKALYCAGYKVKYENIEDKSLFDKDNKTIILKKNLNKQTHLHLLLDTYTSDVSTNEMEKDLLTNFIGRSIGIDTKDINYNDFKEWYTKENLINVDRLLKVLVNKGRKFTNNFNRFFSVEKENLGYETANFYDYYHFSI